MVLCIVISSKAFLPCLPQLKHLTMVTHRVFTPVFFFDVGASDSSGMVGCSVIARRPRNMSAARDSAAQVLASLASLFCSIFSMLKIFLLPSTLNSKCLSLREQERSRVQQQGEQVEQWSKENEKANTNRLIDIHPSDNSCSPPPMTRRRRQNNSNLGKQCF